MYPLLGNPSAAGSVVAVWPAIGMVDVQFPHGVTRYPVEDLAVDSTGEVGDTMGPSEGAVTGGSPVTVSAGPPKAQAARVASRHLEAIYWAAKNRLHQLSAEEIRSGRVCCPRCDDEEMRPTVYKRESGKSVRLLCCPACLFLIRRDDVRGL